MTNICHISVSLDTEYKVGTVWVHRKDDRIVHDYPSYRHWSFERRARRLDRGQRMQQAMLRGDMVGNS